MGNVNSKSTDKLVEILLAIEKFPESAYNRITELNISWEVMETYDDEIVVPNLNIKFKE